MQKVPQHKTINVFPKTKKRNTMLTTTRHTAAKLERIELRKKIAELEKQESFFMALIPVVLTIGGGLIVWAILI